MALGFITAELTVRRRHQSTCVRYRDGSEGTATRQLREHHPREARTAPELMIIASSAVTRQLLEDDPREGHNTTLALRQDVRDELRQKLDELGLSYRDLEEMSACVAGQKNWFERGLAPPEKTKPVTVELPRVDALRESACVEMTQGERMALYLLTRNGERRAGLLSHAQGVTFARGGQPIQLDAARLRAIVESMDSKERALADWMLHVLNREGEAGLKTLLNETWEDMFGFRIAEKEDYFPSLGDQDFRDVEPNKRMELWYNAMVEEHFFKDRHRSDLPFKVHDAFGTFYTHLNRMTAFIGKAKPTHNALVLLRSQEFRKAVISGVRNGEQILKDFEGEIRHLQGL